MAIVKTVAECAQCGMLVYCLPKAALAGRVGDDYICPIVAGPRGDLQRVAVIMKRMVTEIRQTVQHTHGDETAQAMAGAAEATLRRLARELGIDWTKVA